MLAPHPIVYGCGLHNNQSRHLRHHDAQQAFRPQLSAIQGVSSVLQGLVSLSNRMSVCAFSHASAPQQRSCSWRHLCLLPWAHTVQGPAAPVGHGQQRAGACPSARETRCSRLAASSASCSRMRYSPDEPAPHLYAQHPQCVRSGRAHLTCRIAGRRWWWAGGGQGLQDGPSADIKVS